MSSETTIALTNRNRNITWVVLTFILFLIAVDLLIGALQLAGNDAVSTLITAASNPFTAFFIGIATTAILQSSSTVTSITVVLVVTGSLTLQQAVPIVMGANIGTTITSLVVSFAFMSKNKEFKRAVAAGSFHCFFNLLTALIFFPLELAFGFLSKLSESLSSMFASSSQTGQSLTSTGSILSFLTRPIVEAVPFPMLLALAAVVLVFVSVIVFRKVIANLIAGDTKDGIQKFFFQHPAKSFSWGVLLTAAIRSSTVTTSLVVPFAANKMVSLKQAAAFIMGANVGTTITAFIVALLNGNSSDGLAIAIAHFLFNLIGAILFFPIPGLRSVPLRLARQLGIVSQTYRMALLVFIFVIFFIIPFTLIFISQR